MAMKYFILTSAGKWSLLAAAIGKIAPNSVSQTWHGPHSAQLGSNARRDDKKINCEAHLDSTQS